MPNSKQIGYFPTAAHYKQVMRMNMTETMYMTGERHPQSTKLFNGRPLTKGNYATRAELEEEVLDRHNRGYGYKRISRVVGVSDMTVANIIKRWKEKSDGIPSHTK